MRKRDGISRSPETDATAEADAIKMTMEENTISPLVPDGMTAREYLTFQLAGEDYGVDILRVQEIRGWETVTRIPNAPEYVKGVLNLRGSIVPVIDMRQRLGMPYVEYDKETVIIVVKVIDAVRERIMGMVVDAVADVFAAIADSLRNTPKLGTNIDTEYFTGVADTDGRMIMLLDVDRLMCWDAIQEPGGKSAA
jgi:purine-binding chemotaxis protein CheW